MLENRVGKSCARECKNMDFSHLKWFFEDEAEEAEQTFLARDTRPDAHAWLSTCENNLLRRPFIATRKNLMAQYKSIESEVSFDAPRLRQR
jgi:hypothetical protein